MNTRGVAKALMAVKAHESDKMDDLDIEEVHQWRYCLFTKMYLEKCMNAGNDNEVLTSLYIHKRATV